MSELVHLDLQIDPEEKDIVARAAVSLGTTMAAVVHTAVNEKARDLLDRESRITMSANDFREFSAALNGDFTPNEALKKAMGAASKVNRA